MEKLLELGTVGPAVVTASMMLFVAILTASFSFWADKHYGRDYKELKEVLELKKLLNEVGVKDLINDYTRRKNNYYSLIKETGIKRSSILYSRLSTFNKAILVVSVLISLMFLILVTLEFRELSKHDLRVETVISNYIFIFVMSLTAGFTSYIIYSSIKYKENPRVANTKYWATFSDGRYSCKSAIIPINIKYSFNGKSNLCYKYVYISNVEAEDETYYVYEIFHAEGDLSIDSNRDTQMFSRYKFIGIKQFPSIQNSIILTEDSLEDFYIPSSPIY